MKIDKVIERKASSTDLDFLNSLWVRYDKVTLNLNCNFWCLELTLCKIKIIIFYLSFYKISASQPDLKYDL